MANDELILELARSIRPYLAGLFAGGVDAPARSTAVDSELANLLAAARRGTQVDEDILERLSSPPAVRDWAAAFLEHGCPADVATSIEQGNRGYAGLPGEGEPPRPSKLTCPEGDFAFYRRAVGQRVPSCPTHGLNLLPATGP